MHRVVESADHATKLAQAVVEGVKTVHDLFLFHDPHGHASRPDPPPQTFARARVAASHIVRKAATRTSSALPDDGLLGVDVAQVLDHLEHTVACLRDVHVQPEVVLPGDHLGRTAGSLGEARCVERLHDGSGVE